MGVLIPIGIILIWAIMTSITIALQSRFFNNHEKIEDGIFTFIMFFWPVWLPMIFFVKFIKWLHNIVRGNND